MLRCSIPNDMLILLSQEFMTEWLNCEMASSWKQKGGRKGWGRKRRGRKGVKGKEGSEKEGRLGQGQGAWIWTLNQLVAVWVNDLDLSSSSVLSAVRQTVTGKDRMLSQERWKGYKSQKQWRGSSMAGHNGGGGSAHSLFWLWQHVRGLWKTEVGKNLSMEGVCTNNSTPAGELLAIDDL